MIDDPPSPTPRHAVFIGLAAALLRAAVFLTVVVSSRVTVDRYAANGDGASYLAVARAMLGDASHLTEYDRRVFPGYPALIASAGRLGLPLPLAALAIDWLSAGIAAGLAAVVFGDRRVGWAMVMLPPQYLINSSLAMSEAPMLALSLLGIWLVSPEKPVSAWRAIIGGIVLGLAGLVRPMACFAAAGCLFAVWCRREGMSAEDSEPFSSRGSASRRTSDSASPDPFATSGDSLSLVLRLGRHVSLRDANSRARFLSVKSAVLSPFLAAILTVLAGVVAMQYWTGDASRGLRVYRDSPQAYVGRLLAWPFESLIRTPFRERATVEAWSVPYIWLHVPIVLFACARMIRIWRLRHAHAGRSAAGFREQVEWRDALALPWLLGNTLFVLCIGSGWGFRHFPRFNIPALPALFWALHPWLPRRTWIWAALAIAGFAAGVAGVSHSL